MDCTSRVLKTNFNRSEQFPQFLTVRLKWSKNVSDERSAPRQVILGAMNQQVCTVLALALFLEKWIKDGEGAASQWLFCDGFTDSRSDLKYQDAECERWKSSYAKFFKTNVLLNPQFVKDREEGCLGTHSIRKCATTFCRQNGVSKDDTDYRARWKCDGRQQDNYTSTQLTWPDINAASKLCVGGICLYKPLRQSGITNEWLAQSIAPRIANVFGNNIAAILAKPLLWACMDDSMDPQVPEDIKREVVAAYVQLECAVPEGTNPIEKVEVIASESQGVVSFDELADPTDGEEDGGGRQGMRRSQVQWNNAIYAKLCSVQSKMNDMENRQISNNQKMNRKLRRVEQSAQRAAMLAAGRRERDGGGGLNRTAGGGGDGVNPAAEGSGEKPATLMKCPRTISTLWNEYVNGIGGNKPARDFTRRERGKVKHRYSARLVLWRAIQRLVDRGYRADEAIRRINRVYSAEKSITAIMKKMKLHERHGGHAELR